MLFDHNDDWQESFRRWLYPKLDAFLERLDNHIPINLYAKYTHPYKGYIGELGEEEEFEKQLDSVARRNPIAAFKELPDGRKSEGSWVVLHEDSPDIVEQGMQLHITLFPSKNGVGVVGYAHYEYDWRDHPLKHLRAKDISYTKGEEKAKEILK
jgi:hypothetical protein